MITITTPTTAPTMTAVGPFLSLAGTGSNVSGIVSWQNDRGGADNARGSTDWTIHNIPLAPGQNVISVSATSGGQTTTRTLTVNSDEFAYYLAEGSTGGFFDTDISSSDVRSG